MPELEEDLALLVEAAEIAGEISLRHFRNSPESWAKPDGAGPVSIADLEVNEALEAFLRERRPSYGWLSEESPDSAERPMLHRVFVLDPIDGTRAFLEGTTAFAHALAVVERGRVIAGVVYLPALERLYRAAEGKGATLNGAPIGVSNVNTPAQAQILASRPTLSPENWPGGVPEGKRVYRPSLAYRLCLVAQGRFDAVVTLGNAWEWDIAAGTLIAREAGAVVTDATGGMPPFNSPARKHAGCIAAAPVLHAQLIGLRNVA